MRDKVNTRISSELLGRYLADRCTPAEEQLIAEWYASFEELPPYFDNEHSEVALELKASAKATIQSIISNELPRQSRVRRIMNYGSVAAAILVLCMAGSHWFFSSGKTKKKIVAQAPVHMDSISITPGANKAVLTLADGSVIDLDKVGNGTIATEGKMMVNKKEDGQLEYQGAHSPLTAENSPAYNILSTPKGGQYQITLPDGSKVWLNAASSIKYPTVFTGKERRVDITGEVYFEVAHDSRKPFIVHVPGGSQVEVLGTHFNVNAYADEGAVKTTLLEGSVKITKDAASALLKPGEQASVSQTSQISQPIPVQTDEVMAWKNGLFQFNNVTIETVMRQVARWYDVQVVYERDVSQELFRGKIYRNADISQLLKILELSGAHFKIEGKKIIVQ